MLTLNKLLSKTEPALNGCLNWTGAIYQNQRGYVRVDGKPQLVYRVIWEMTKGPIPVGQHVCHKCDNPTCVNAEHLFLGSHADNMRDAQIKGRFRRGEACSFAKLTQQDVDFIRSQHGLMTRKQLAEQFKVCKDTISKIFSRKRWYENKK